MSDRRQELERKKQKLALIREEKEKRRREKLQESKENSQNLETVKDLHSQTDELLDSLGIPSAALLSRQSGNSSVALNQVPEPKEVPSPLPQLLQQSLIPEIPSRKPNLVTETVHQLSIPPKETVVYNKQTQTTNAVSDREARPVDYYVLTYGDVSVEEDAEGSSLTSHERDTPTFFAPGQQPHKVTGLPNVGMVQPAVDTSVIVASSDQKKEGKNKPCDLSEEEKKKIMLSDDFHKFFDYASRIVERALFEGIDVTTDYTGTAEENDKDDKSGSNLSLNRIFQDERWSKKRAITGLDWSVQYPELLVASYNNNLDMPNDPDGVCLIWNMRFKKTTPEYIFHCQSPVMSTCFAKFHPNLVLGGTYSGQIMLWDNRVNKRTPVQRSPLSSVAHTHPVYSIQVVGTQNSHNLVSVSTDGKFCSWSLDMLSAPQDTMDLSHQKQSRTVSVTCMTFPTGDQNNFVVGGEDGTIYSACRHGSKTGITEVFEGHQGPITGISMHRAAGLIDFSHLFLSSSFDWTVKLWSLKHPRPLHSFEVSNDYVFDTAWSPTHPALFTCVDSMGKLDVWNLNSDPELPVATATVDGISALNKVIWAPSGHHILVGDDMGRIHVYDVGEHLCNPRNEEWSFFRSTIQELESRSIESELQASNLSPENIYLLPIR